MDGVCCRHEVSPWWLSRDTFKVPGLEGYHNFPTVPQFLNEFVILVLPIPAARLTNRTDNRPVTRLPDSGHRGVRLSRDSPPVRVDVHGELIQVLKDPERLLVCERVLLDNPIRLQVLVREGSDKKGEIPTSAAAPLRFLARSAPALSPAVALPAA